MAEGNLDPADRMSRHIIATDRGGSKPWVEFHAKVEDIDATLLSVLFDDSQKLPEDVVNHRAPGERKRAEFVQRP
jgi:hypothetical protein